MKGTVSECNLIDSVARGAAEAQSSSFSDVEAEAQGGEGTWSPSWRQWRGA